MDVRLADSFPMSVFTMWIYGYRLNTTLFSLDVHWKLLLMAVNFGKPCGIGLKLHLKFVGRIHYQAQLVRVSTCFNHNVYLYTYVHM